MERALFRFYMDNKRHLPGIAFIVGISLVSGILKMLSATYWGRAVDYGIAGMVEEMLAAAVLMAVFILADGIRTALHYHIIGRVTENMFLEVRTKAFEKILQGDVAVLEKKFRTGDIAVRLNNDIDFLSIFSANHLSDFSRQIFSGIFGLVACIFLSWQMSVAYLVILPLSLWMVNAISRPIQAQSKSSMDDTGAAMGIASDMIAGALTVKAFAGEEMLGQRFDRAIDRAYGQMVKSEKQGMKMTGVKYVATVMQTMCLFLVGSALVSSGRLGAGAFISFVTLSGYITAAFEHSDYMLLCVRRAIASACRYYEAIDIPEEWQGLLREAREETPCEARDLYFSYAAYDDGSVFNNGGTYGSYGAGAAPALAGLDIQIPRGKKVAIVGASGCGKSTLVKLICRFYLPGKGSLALFGAEAPEWEAGALREHMAIVTQDAVLFHGSIYENVAYGNPAATRQDCEAALREVALWDFVCGFPDGMDHCIGEGGNSLSGGQRQRLCIARAMVKKADLVLLDEATSALDFQTEREVQDALDKLLAGRTAVIIAHRLSTVQDADYIYCMEHGRVAEEGTPGELLEKKGMYYEMCRMQGMGRNL